jgi:hypothetical protein
VNLVNRDSEDMEYVPSVTSESKLLTIPFKRTQCTQIKSARWSQWLCGLVHTSATASLLTLQVRIPPGAFMCVVSVVRCQEVSATS